MRVYLLIILVITFHKIVAQPSDNQKINEILLSVEKEIKKINTISYYASFESINSGREDSISKAEGKVWLKRNNKDSIFGATFHVQGQDGGGTYDYYYDGTKSYEIRHNNKTLTLFDPYKFENNANNPAKARTALNPLIYLLTDKNLIKTLKQGNPIIDLIEQENFVKIHFQYPLKDNGMEITKQLQIDRESHNIEKIQEIVLWNGTVFKYNIEIDSISINSQEIENNIDLQNTYSSYAIKEFNRKENQPSISRFIGQTAKNFQHPTYSNEIVTLKDQRGKYVLLDFWESWCGHCIITLPTLQKLQEKYEQLSIIGITTENKKQIENIIQKNGLTYTNIFADQAILKDYEIQGRPTYFLIDKNGLIIEHSFGDLDKIISRLEEIH